MALIECLGCGKQISDRAISCPQCGRENLLVSEEIPERAQANGREDKLIEEESFIGSSKFRATSENENHEMTTNENLIKDDISIFIYCQNCGTKISISDAFCFECGWKNQEENSSVNNEEVNTKIEKEETIIQEQKKSVSKGYDPGLERSRNKEGDRLKTTVGLFALFMIFSVIFSLPPETWVECGEKYWNENDRYVRKRC